MNKRNGLSGYRLEKPLRAFVADLTASQTALILGLSRTTVNRYYHLFRTAIAANQRDLARAALCSGTVEVDESYFGPSRPRGVLGPLKRGRGTLKQPVFGVFERGARVFTEIVPDTNKQTLQRLIRGRIALEATAVSDGWCAYDGLVDVGSDRHLKEWEWRWGKNPDTLLKELKIFLV